MSEYHADQEETVLAYVRLKSGMRPFNRYGEGAGFSRQATKDRSAKGKAANDKPLHSGNVIDLARERAKRLR